jgi:DNA-binding NtrC family response regulator
VALESKTEALERLREIKPDVVTTDLMAPQLNGFEFTRRVKGIDTSIPVIVISGCLTAENAREAIRLGAFDCIRKPCSVAEIRQVVDRALEARRSSSENYIYSKRRKSLFTM